LVSLGKGKGEINWQTIISKSCLSIITITTKEPYKCTHDQLLNQNFLLHRGTRYFSSWYPGYARCLGDQQGWDKRNGKLTWLTLYEHNYVSNTLGGKHYLHFTDEETEGQKHVWIHSLSTHGFLGWLISLGKFVALMLVVRSHGVLVVSNHGLNGRRIFVQWCDLSVSL
jgi:hypothetical protein